MAAIKSDDYESVVDWLFCQSTFLHNDKHYTITVNSLRNTIYEMKPIPTGFASKKAIEFFNGKTSAMTKEHFNPRQKMAEKMVNMVKSGASKEEVLEIFMEAVRIHWVHPLENKALIPYQREDDYIAEEAYKKCNIELVEHQSPPRTKLIDVDGTIYESAKLAAQAFDISVQSARNRAAGKVKKYKNWKYV